MASIFKRGDRRNYRISYFDHRGRRQEISSHTTDKRTAERIAAKLEAEQALVREGVVDASQASLVQHNRRPLADHVADYLAHCKRAELCSQIIKSRARHLRWIQELTGATRLSDLTAESFERARAELRSQGLSAQTANGRQESVRAFLNWCVKTGRAASNPLRILSKLNVDADRRYLRRALTEEELGRLFEVAKGRGRLLFYAMAFYAGIRRGELCRIQWGDVDLDAGTLTMRKGKAKRTDVIPLHPDLQEILREVRPAAATHESRLFPEVVTNQTRVRDFERAKIPLIDSKGLRADLHSTRMTLHTMLALRGVPVQVAQRLMRHADYRTTQKHYFHMDTSAAGSALRALPTIGIGHSSKGEDRQQKRQQTAHDSAHSGADACNSEEDSIDQSRRRKPLESAELRKTVPRGSTPRTSNRKGRVISLGNRRSILLSYGRVSWGMIAGGVGRPGHPAKIAGARVVRCWTSCC